MKPFPGYFTGSMAFFDQYGNEICKAEDLYYLYQFFKGQFGSRYIQAFIKRPGKIAAFLITIDQLGWTRSGSIGPDPECDIKMPVLPMFPGGIFFIKNFMFSIHPDPPKEIEEFVEAMGNLKVEE